jgi:hypothetical protein
MEHYGVYMCLHSQRIHHCDTVVLRSPPAASWPALRPFFPDVTPKPPLLLLEAAGDMSTKEGRGDNDDVMANDLEAPH